MGSVSSAEALRPYTSRVAVGRRVDHRTTAEALVVS